MAVSKILVVDDHPIVRQGLAKLINQEPDLTVCTEASDSPSAVKGIEETKPDLAIVDVSLDGVSGIELIKIIKERFPNVPVLVLSMHDESLYAERALRAGAKGYIMKQEAAERVILAIRRVRDGGIYLSEKMSEKLLHKLVGGQAYDVESPVERLSDRELEIFQLIGQGLTTRKIAEKLHLSVKTIESHRAHIKEKLRLKNATELMHFAIKWSQEPHDV